MSAVQTIADSVTSGGVRNRSGNRHPEANNKPVSSSSNLAKRSSSSPSKSTAGTGDHSDLLEFEMAARKKAKKSAVRTLADVAQFFGFSPQTVKPWRMTRNPRPVPGRSGKYPLNEIATRMEQCEFALER